MTWDDIYTDQRYLVRKFPAPILKDWFRSNFGSIINPMILDVGCGVGRNAWYLAEQGASVHAIDTSKKAIDALARENLKSGKIHVVKVADVCDLDYEHSVFDGILCYGVLYYLTPEQIQRAVTEMAQVLRHDGKILCITRTPDDKRTLGYVPAIERDMPMVYMSQSEVREVFKNAGLKIISLGHITTEYDGLMDDDWVIQATKPW